MSQQTLEFELRRLEERLQEQPDGRVFAPLADVLRKLGKHDEALRVCLTGLARHPGYSSAHVILGKIHLERGDDDSARESFEKVLEIDPQNLLALRHLARMEEGAGDFEAALDRWEHIRHLEPDSDAVEERVALLVRKLAGETPLKPVPAATAPVDGPAAVSSPETEIDPFSPEAHEETDEADEEAELEPEVDEASPDSDVDDVSAPVDEPAPTARVAGPDVPAAEIATMTLAEIYAEQGFKSKALDIFRQVRERSPHVEGIDARIEAIEAELDRVQREVPVPPEASLADLEPAAPEGSPVAPPPVETESVPSPPLTAPEDTVQEEERERRDHFRTWLERLKTDES